METEAVANESLCPKMTYTQRLYGFICCFVVGWCLTIFSFARFVSLVQGNPIPFVVMYTVGNILAIMSSMFLAGPKRQWKNMTKNDRLCISICYVVSMIATLVVAFVPMDIGASLPLLLVLIIVQFCCMVWYTLSYIPYGRTTAKTCMRNTCCGTGE